MGYDYALVHLWFNVPPAFLLSLIYRPFFTRLDAYRILFLISIAVTATIPWDAYLIHIKVWTYPTRVIIGPKLFGIPLEEVFFFVIQTYTTSLLYLLLSKPTFRSVYLRHETKADPWRYYKLFGTLLLALAFKAATTLIKSGGQGTYLALILLWAVPFLSILWHLAYQFIIGLPVTETLVPILLPTFYLWIVDTLALKRGTWVIEHGTKLGIHLWPNLDIEEAVFFLLTNTMIVFGLIAFDNATTLLDTFPSRFPPSIPSALPSPVTLLKALLLPAESYDRDRVQGLRQAADRLRRKSRSFFLASAVFERRLRIDLVTLYSFCRVADDFIDTAKTPSEAREWVSKLRKFLDLSYADSAARGFEDKEVVQYVVENFPKDTHLALLQLPTDRLPPQPLYDLTRGFETDVEFTSDRQHTEKSTARFPIKTEHDLDLYGQRVAGTVASLCISLVYFNYPAASKPPSSLVEHLHKKGSEMGIAIQCVNIARDLHVDARANRLYIPSEWLASESLTPDSALEYLSNPTPTDNKDMAAKMLRLRHRLLDRAFAFHQDARPAIEQLPRPARAAMRVAVESYMEIGRVLKTRTRIDSSSDVGLGARRATVPVLRRLVVAYRALVG